MGRGAVKVVLRTRPTDQFATECLKFQDGTVQFHYPRKNRDKPGTSFVNNTAEYFSFKLDDILHNETQERVYEATCRPIVDSVIQGFNGTVLAYGQTGAGKTYTMTGGGDYRSRGITPRAIADVFHAISHLPEKAFEVQVSYLELYNEKVRDLLAEEGGEYGGGVAHLAVQEDASTGISVKGLTKKTTAGEADALALLFDGNQRRAIGEHATNAISSRSHCIFTIHVRSRSRVESGGNVLSSKLNLVDLAGSERVAKTGSEGTILREATYINRSLSFLEQVVLALSSQNRSHIPYRQCKLTNVLKDSIGGNCRTVMVANVWGEERHLDETLSTLKFATRMMKVQNEATVNVEVDPATQIRSLQKQITELKAELQMQNQLHGKSHVKYDALTDDERCELEKHVQQYLTGSLEDLNVRNLRDVKEYFKLFKACVERAEAEAEDKLRSRYDLSAKNAPPAAGLVGEEEAEQTGGGVGQVESASGFGIGTAAAAKNLAQANLMQSPTRGVSVAGGQQQQQQQAGDTADTVADAASQQTTTLPDRGQAFEDYKINEGAEQAANIKNSTMKLRELKAEGLSKTQQLSELKADIDELKKSVEAASEDAREGDEVLDADRYQIYDELKRKKIAFKQLHEEVSAARMQRDATQKLLNQARQQLVEGFEAWYDSTYCSHALPAPSSFRKKQQGQGDEKLDEGERFDRLEIERITRDDPEALEFYKAQKMAQSRSKAKRGAGWVAARGGVVV